MIAHRLSTILAADVIFVLQDGRLVDRGGLYRTLYEYQFRLDGQRQPGSAVSMAAG